MFTLNCRGRLLVIDRPLIMGIINTTPDSFYTDSRTQQLDKIVSKAEEMLQQGAAILDIGGQSTRPQSKRIPAEIELERVLPAIEAVKKHFPDAILSVDTYYASVAREAVEAGASIINDVTAGTIDDTMFSTVAQLQVPYVLMHLQGTLETMHINPTYKNVVLDVFDFLNFKLKELHQMGINDVLIDPGFGFGKTIQHNFQLLQNFSYLQKLNKPILLGLSRKGTIYKTLRITPEEALNGTTVLNTVGLLQGAQILRVHDVKEARQAVELITALNNAPKGS